MGRTLILHSISDYSYLEATGAVVYAEDSIPSYNTTFLAKDLPGLYKTFQHAGITSIINLDSKVVTLAEWYFQEIKWLSDRKRIFKAACNPKVP